MFHIYLDVPHNIEDYFIQTEKPKVSGKKRNITIYF